MGKVRGRRGVNLVYKEYFIIVYTTILFKESHPTCSFTYRMPAVSPSKLILAMELGFFLFLVSILIYSILFYSILFYSILFYS